MKSISIEQCKQFLTVKETANYFNVSTHTIYKLVEEHELKAVNVRDRCIRISVDEIMDFVKRKMEEIHENRADR